MRKLLYLRITAALFHISFLTLLTTLTTCLVLAPLYIILYLIWPGSLLIVGAATAVYIIIATSSKHHKRKVNK